MDIRTFFRWGGIVLLIGSFWWGDWAIWVGAPLVFLGIIFQFLDKE